jgi:transposase-like protein
MLGRKGNGFILGDVCLKKEDEAESARNRLSALNNLKNRGVKNILTLFFRIKEAISAVFPMTDYQRCIVYIG